MVSYIRDDLEGGDAQSMEADISDEMLNDMDQSIVHTPDFFDTSASKIPNIKFEALSN